MRSTPMCLSLASPTRVARRCLLLIVLALAIAGCGAPESDSVFDVTYNPCEPLVVEATHELRPGERDAIERAVAMWNEAASLHIRDARGQDDTAADAARLPVRFEKGAPFVNGYYSDETGEVIINRNLADTRERTITLAHELGHAFGLRHVAPHKRRSLMNAGNLDTELTQRDIEVLRERWQGCPAPPRSSDL